MSPNKTQIAPTGTSKEISESSMPLVTEGEPEERLITVERKGAGQSLVFLARTRNAAEVAELDELFSELKAGCHVRILSRGPLMAAAARVVDDTDGESTSELMALLETLGERYSFFKVDLGLHPTLNRLIEDMALDTGSELHPTPNCSLCSRPEPFPTRLTLEKGGKEQAEGLYCSGCVAQFADRNENEQEIVGALLHSDRNTFIEGEKLEVSPNPSRKGNRVTYRIRRRKPALALG